MQLFEILFFLLVHEFLGTFPIGWGIVVEILLGRGIFLDLVLPAHELLGYLLDHLLHSWALYYHVCSHLFRRSKKQIKFIQVFLLLSFFFGDSQVAFYRHFLHLIVL